MITGTSRGHAIIYENGQWQWLDSKISITNERPCKKCGRMPTPEGYDACLGFVNGATATCCGHGIKEKVIIY